ncbi:MAG: hypothetical protein M3R15_22020 [Acidobacteriota bacterium]|nr:hypothetical protein [Acidobacteriota bacterium]
MNQEAEQLELTPQNTIRTETVLSRFPVHRLAKHGNINIDIRERTGDGEVKTKWEVSYNSKYGQPGPLAYKVDSLVINRRVEEAPRPIPKIIKLGSLRDVCRELELNEGQALRQVKKALLQNASAFITAKRSYKGTDGTERTAEISDTRYGVIFTGERFPDGGRADAVYILLHDAYREVLDAAPTRPLDYNYLKELSPGAQRLYELLSYQIFGALRHERPRAKMLYSYYCTRAPQTRYLDYDHVKKQMYKLHVPHKQSGYIAAVEFRETTDSVGQPDWEMLYTPGRRAKAEFRASMRRQQTIDVKPVGSQPRSEAPPLPPAQETPAPEIAPRRNEEANQLVKELLEHGLHFDTAQEMVSADPEEVRRQLEYLPYRIVKKNKAGLLRDAIVGHWTPPDDYLEVKRKEQEQRDNQERLQRKAAETEHAAARQQEEERRRAAYFAYLRCKAGQIEQEQPAVYSAFLDDATAKRTALEKDPAHKGAAKKIYLRLFDDEQSHLERLRDYFGEPSFEEWCKHHG